MHSAKSATPVKPPPRSPVDGLALGTLMTFLFNRNKDFTKNWLVETGARGAYRSRLFQMLWPSVSEFTLLDQFRADHLLGYFESALDRPGDIVECGVYTGGISLLLASVLREFGIKKKIYMFDSFAGLPAPNREFDAYYGAGWLRADEKTLQALIERRGLGQYCVIKKGWFRDRLPELPKDQQLCFVHVDCDLYDSCLETLQHLYPKLVAGAPMIFDDYYDGSGGVQKAVDDWVSHTGEIIHLGPAPQATILKGITAKNTAVSCFHADGTSAPDYSTDHLQGNKLYLHFLNQMSELLSSIGQEFDQFARTLTNQSDSDRALGARSFGTVFRALLAK
jgi:hypothetical protein